MNDIRRIQEHVLTRLLGKAEHTLWGERYHFGEISGYEEFRKCVPVSDYHSLKPVIEQIRDGESDILWPGSTNDFAVSSGTTGIGKHLPLSRERLQSDRRFMRKLIRHFIKQCPNPQIWFGKQASLPGSVEDVSYHGRNLVMGEISGFTAREAPKWLTPFQVISPRRLCRLGWKEKFDICIRKALNEDVRVITAVPSWTLIFLQEALKQSGSKSIGELWPNLQLIVCGGVALRNYRHAIGNICSPLRIRFMESYGASEGYFAFTHKLEEPELQLVTDNGIFYEWVPFEPGLDESQLAERALPSWEIKVEQDYIMVVTTNAGLWRYPVNDIIRFKDADHLSIEIRGRVSEMLDDYGEAVHYSELEGMVNQLEATGGGRHIQLIATVKPPDAENPPRHIWVIIWSQKPDYDERAFSNLMDTRLSALNRHYAIRRESGAMDKPQVIFLDSNGKSESSLLRDNKLKAQIKPLRIISFDKLPEFI